MKQKKKLFEKILIKKGETRLKKYCKLQRKNKLLHKQKEKRTIEDIIGGDEE